MLGQDGHAPYIVNKLWGEFMPTPPSTAVLSQLATEYTAGGRKLKPLVRSILTNPQLFESIDEPNMIKPPVVFVTGTLRALGLGVIVRPGPPTYLDSMGQLPYFPPTVAGWEGGLSWLNTNTALARFGFVADVIGNAPNGSPAKVVDVPNETPTAAFDRALRRSRLALDERRHARRDPGLRRPRLGEGQQGPHRTPGHAAHAHARRPRRTGDVK